MNDSANPYTTIHDEPKRNSNKRPASDELITVRASEIKIRAIRWLWANRFALGKVGIIGGMPDMGKGLITANISARVTTGGKWPCGEGQAPIGQVILLTAEDDLDDTVARRHEPGPYCEDGQDEAGRQANVLTHHRLRAAGQENQ